MPSGMGEFTHRHNDGVGIAWIGIHGIILDDQGRTRFRADRNRVRATSPA